MKKILLTLFLSLVILGFVKAQEQWKFSLAFEDATGARDTLWFVWDTTATFYGADSALGEMSASINSTEFNVWTYNDGLAWLDTVKTVALPFDYCFHSSIYAINFELPITVKWDSSLFHAPWLPPLPVGWVNDATLYNAYFFSVCGSTGNVFNMTSDDYVIAPYPGAWPSLWEPWLHFPMEIYMCQNPTIGLNDFDTIKDGNMVCFPNPVLDKVDIIINDQIDAIRIFDLKGTSIDYTLMKKINEKHQTIFKISIDGLPVGVYLINAYSQKNNYHGKIIKIN